MKMHMAILILLFVFLLLGGVALAQSVDPVAGYSVKGTTAGGGYSLTTLDWAVSGIAAGEGYYLLSPTTPDLNGSGCCCIYLPCVARNQK